MKMVRYAVVLGLICIAAAFGVSGTYYITKGRIDDKTLLRQLGAQALAVKLKVAPSPRFVELRPQRPEGANVLEARTTDGKGLGYFGSGATHEPSAERVIRYFAQTSRTEEGSATYVGLDAAGKVVCTFAVMNPEVEEDKQVVVARDGAGEVMGYVARGEAQGYGGKIVVMVGMDLAAERIIGMAIVSQTETPGLGTRIAEIESKKTWGKIVLGLLYDQGEAEPEETMPWFLKRFIEHTFEELREQVEGKATHIQAITGATISSNGTISAAWDAVNKIRNVSGSHNRNRNHNRARK